MTVINGAKVIVNKKIVCLSAIALCLCLNQSPYADSERAPPLPGEGFETVVQSLHLSADQKAGIQNIREKAETAIHLRIEEIHSLRQQTNDLLSTPTLDEDKLDSVIGDEKEAIGSILKIRAMERHDISDLLTAEQKATFTGMIKRWEKKQQEQR